MDPATLNELVFSALDAFRQPALLKFRTDAGWQGISAQDVERRIREMSLGLGELGVKPGDRVALLSENRPEWLMSDAAILTARAVVVPIYPTLPAAAVEQVLAHSEAKVLLCSSAAQAAKADRARLPKLKHVVVFDAPLVDAKTLADVVKLGGERAAKEPYLHRAEAQRARPDDLATIIYTSGTTGDSKGVMLSHGNITSNVNACTRAIRLEPGDLALSILPLAHIFERMMTFSLLRTGAAIAFGGPPERVPHDLAEVHPTVVAAVPRFFEKMHDKIMANVRAAKPSRRKMFDAALEVGRERSRCEIAGRPLPRALEWKWRIARMLVFRKVREALGGNIRVFISGGAPLPREIGEFFHAAGLTILEGYGLTETSPVLTVNRMDDLKFGTVGKPVADVDVRIAEDGEILARGPGVMQGYYKAPKETKEALAGGWFHTGDVGHFDSQGFLVITDRKKDLIKTSGGKYVAPQPIESALRESKFVQSAVVLGDRRKYCIALVVPRFDSLDAWAGEKQLAFPQRHDLLNSPPVRELYETELARINAGKAPFETIKKFALLDRDFTLADGELTPTLKVKRRVIEERHRALIDALYANGTEEPPGNGKQAH